MRPDYPAILRRLEQAADFMARQDPHNLRGRAHYQKGFIDGLIAAAMAFNIAYPALGTLQKLGAEVEARRARR